MSAFDSEQDRQKSVEAFNCGVQYANKCTPNEIEDIRTRLKQILFRCATVLEIEPIENGPKPITYQEVKAVTEQIEELATKFILHW